MFSISKPLALTSLSISEWALLLFGVLLVLGLIGEFLADHEPKKFSKIRKLKRVFEILVIAGVAGEILADGGIFTFSGRLQSLSDLEVAASNERAKTADENANEAALRVAEIGRTNAQLSLTIEQLRSTNLSFAVMLEGLHSNNLVVDARLTQEANEAQTRGESFAASNALLSLDLENLRSSNLLTERTVEELRNENLQLQAKMITGLYERSHFEMVSINDKNRVFIQHKIMKPRIFILLPKAPIPVSINAVIVWHPDLLRGFAGLLVGSEFNKFLPMIFGNNKNVLYSDIFAPEWDRLEYPSNAYIIIRYTELEQETNLWKKIALKGGDVYFDNAKQVFQ